jgi:trehalose-phosphatase
VDGIYAPRDQAAKLKTSLAEIITSKWPVIVTDGKCVVEARLECIHKGQIVQDFLRDFEPDFVLCAGDDLTDEGNVIVLWAVTRYLLI